jgi:hypothetical protein
VLSATKFLGVIRMHMYENGSRPLPKTDLEQFICETWNFINKVCPDSSLDKKGSAVASIAYNFKWLFDNKGKRKIKRS